MTATRAAGDGALRQELAERKQRAEEKRVLIIRANQSLEDEDGIIEGIFNSLTGTYIHTYIHTYYHYAASTMLHCCNGYIIFLTGMAFVAVFSLCPATHR